MPIIKITRADLSKYKPVKPGWYELECKEVGDGKPAKSGSNAVVYETVFEIVGPSEKGVEVKEWFNDAGVFRIAACVASVEGIKQDELFASAESEEVDIELSTIIGRRVLAEIINEQYNGNLINKIKQFAKIGAVPF